MVGSVGPFGLKTNMPILFDNNILYNEHISIGSGRRGTGLILTVNNLLIALGDNIQKGDFASQK